MDSKVPLSRAVPVTGVVLIALVLIFGIAYAQSYSVQWARYAGGASGELANAVAADSSGNSYITGQFTGNATFGETAVSSVGSSDVFLAKYDPSGNLLWATSAGGSNFDVGLDVTVDSNDDVYVIGSFLGEATFDSTTLTSMGGRDIFVAKFNPLGDSLWAVSAGGIGDDSGLSIALALNDGLFITGAIGGDATFGGINLTGVVGVTDQYLAKMDSDGNFVWARNEPGTGRGSGYGVALDGSGNVFVTGYFSGDLAFGGDNLSSGHIFEYDFMLLKYDPTGIPLWGRQATGSSLDIGYGVASDSAGNSIVTGYFRDDFEFGAPFNFYRDAESNIFTAKYDPDGILLWVREAQGVSHEWGYDVIVDTIDNVLITGFFETQININGVNLTTTVPGDEDAIVVSYDQGGNLIWVKQIGGDYRERSLGLDLDNSGNFFIAGFYGFGGPANIDGITLPALGLYDIFVAKYAVPVDDVLERLRSTIDQLVLDGELTKGQGNALLTKLVLAANILDQGGPANPGEENAAIASLTAFVNQVEDFVETGELSQEDGQALIDAAEFLIEYLGTLE